MPLSPARLNTPPLFFSPESPLDIERERESRRGTEGKKRRGRGETDRQTLTALATCLNFGNVTRALGKSQQVWESLCGRVSADVRLHTRVHTRTHAQGQSAEGPGSTGLPHMALLNGSFCISATAFPRHSVFPEFHLRRSPSPCPSSFL